jgi:hypothetical protein
MTKGNLKRKRRSQFSPPDVSGAIQSNLASRVIRENLDWVKNAIQIAEPLGEARRSGKVLMAQVRDVLQTTDTQKLQQGRELLERMNAYEIVNSQHEAVTYGALYRSTLSDVAPYFSLLHDQFALIPNTDIEKLSNDLQFAADGIQTFNKTTELLSRELQEAELTPETLEQVRPSEVIQEFIREELQEAREQGERLKFFETQEENAQLHEQLEIATKKNDFLIECLEDANRHIEDLKAEIAEKEASKAKRADERDIMFV